MNKNFSIQAVKLMTKYLHNEETTSVIYKSIAKRIPSEKNKQTLLKISSEELEHAKVWRNYTGQTVKASKIRIYWYIFLSYILGFTFVVKLLEKGEYSGIQDYHMLEYEIPEIAQIIKQEKEHEDALMNMLDEERLQYVGAIVLGLNDALVELTGAIAGLTFALANTRIIALAGIITGVSATLSMGASNYLAQRSDGNPNAFKASLYTGIAYLVTVIILVMPYLLFPENMYGAALAVMLFCVVLIIFIFNYYVSVAKSVPFFKRFAEMAAISIGVAIIAFVIGLIAKKLIGVSI